MEELRRESCSLLSQAIALANKEVEKVIGRTKKRGVQRTEYRSTTLWGSLSHCKTTPRQGIHRYDGHEYKTATPWGQEDHSLAESNFLSTSLTTLTAISYRRDCSKWKKFRTVNISLPKSVFNFRMAAAHTEIF